MLAVGGITLFNESVVHGRPVDWRIPVATGIAAGMLAMVERISEGAAVGIAYVALVTILLARVKPNVPSPIESLVDWTGIGH
jgi:hypothetical protein